MATDGLPGLCELLQDDVAYVYAEGYPANLGAFGDDGEGVSGEVVI
jgi:hypothetical protein